jgi:uncharacterized membrane protein YeaQ/YmgE (transglycosylase-associated protein family)
VTKLGGVIGFVLGFALTIYVGDHISWVSRQSDFAGTATATAFGIVGAALGSHLVRRLMDRHARTRSRSVP